MNIKLLLLCLNPLIESFGLVVVHYHNWYLSNRQMFRTTNLDWSLNVSFILVFRSVELIAIGLNRDR